MKRKYIALIGTLAAFLVVACAAFGFEPVVLHHTLDLCVEWTKGFTGHLDGLGGALHLADALVLVRFKKKHGDHDTNDEVRVTEEQATAYKTLGIAERVNGGGDGSRQQNGSTSRSGTPAVQLTDEQYQRLFGGEPTQEEIDEATRQLANQDRQRTPAPDLGADRAGGDGHEREGLPLVTVGFNRETHWKRRAVRYIRASVRGGSGNVQDVQDAQRDIAELTLFALDQPATEFRREYEEAVSLVERSSLDAKAKHRVRILIDQYAEDLQALRSVDKDKRARFSPLAPSSASERTMSTISDTAGGYLVPTPMLAEIFVYIEEYGYARSLFRMIPMTSNEIKWKDIGTKPTAAWYGELDLIAASDIAWGEGGLSTSKLAAITSLSRELEEDAMIAILPVYIQLIGEAIAEKEDLAAIRGDGTSTYGGFTGVLNLASPNGTTTLASGKTSFADFDIDEAINVVFSLSKKRRARAKWLLPESTIKGLLQLKVNSEANHYAILRDPENPAMISRLLGYPVEGIGIEDSFFPTDAVSTTFGAFGDFERSLFGTRRGFTVETSREGVLSNSSGVVTLNAYQQDATLVKVTERVAIGHPQQDAYQLIKTAAS